MKLSIPLGPLVLAAALLAALALVLPAAALPAPPPGDGHSHGDPAAPAAAPAAAAGSTLPAAAGSIDAKAAFERIKKLAGDWQGTMMGPDGPATNGRFELTAGGNAVLEKLFAGSDHEMVNVYYMDGADLALTHYCDSGNHPRMVFAPGKSSPDLLVFDFASATGFDPAKAPHIHSGRLAFQGDDQVESEWNGYAEGKPTDSVKVLLSRRR